MGRGASTTERPYSRAAGASGLAFVVAMSAALFAPGQPPRASDSAASIASGLADDRGVILVATWAGGVGLIAAIWFFYGVAAWLAGAARAAQRPPSAGAAAAGGAGGPPAPPGPPPFFRAPH